MLRKLICMKDKSSLSGSTRLLLYAGNALLVIPLYIYLIWIYSSIASEDFFGAVTLFTNSLPDFISTDGAIKISLVCGLLSLTAGIAALRMHLIPWRLNMFIVIANCILLFLNIFQLM